MPDPTPNFTAQVFASVRNAKNATASHMMLMPNVNAVGIGFKNAGRGSRNDLCVVVSVEHKLPLNELREPDRVPSAIDGVPTDVVETGRFAAFGAQIQRMRPARPGVSIGLADESSAGTFGCLLQRDGRRYILSNNHVVGKSNLAALGSAIVQPAILDGGTPADRIGRLVEFVPIAFDGEPEPKTAAGCSGSLSRVLGKPRQPVEPVNRAGRNQVDCALVAPDDDALVSPDVMGIGAPRGTGLAILGMPVQKSGRTSGHTRSEILQIDVSVKVDYAGRTAVFVDQVMAGAMSSPGDSGSMVFDMQSNTVGLLFAGCATHTLINPIQIVLSALRAELVIVA